MIIQEGSVKIDVPTAKKVSKDMEIFYNPAMKLNRDITVLLLNSIDNTNLQIADPLAATGVRSLRFLIELSRGKIKKIDANDINGSFKKKIQENITLNRIKKSKSKILSLFNHDANIFLLNSSGYDYIDIDPFGSPIKFLESSIARLARNGVLGVTATDTSSLSGTFESSCLRKYFAKSLRNELMHETGLRILIRRVQLIGASHEKALTPVFSYSLEHYMRVFFKCEKGIRKCDELLKHHKYLLHCPACLETRYSIINYGKSSCGNDFEYAGPLWTGALWDKKLTHTMLNASKNSGKYSDEVRKFLELLDEESGIVSGIFYNIHRICKVYRMLAVKKSLLIEKIRKQGFEAGSTHLKPEGIRSSIPLQKLVEIMRKENSKENPKENSKKGA